MYFFLIGRRMCVGEQLAKTELYLFTSNLLLRYRIRFRQGFTPPSDLLAITRGFVRECVDYEVTFTER